MCFTVGGWGGGGDAVLQFTRLGQNLYYPSQDASLVTMVTAARASRHASLNASPLVPRG